MDEFIIRTSFAISMVSLFVITYGTLLGIYSFIKNEFGRLTGKYSLKNVNSVKIDFGYYLLLGLDFLIASDVVRTILENTLHDLTILGISVVIRTLLSYFLGKEITEDERIREKLNEAEELKS